jgi:hypothetical protein
MPELQIFDAQCSRCGQPQSKHDKKVVNGGIGVGDRSVVQVCPPSVGVGEVEVHEFWVREKPLRCPDCGAPLFPGKDGSVACDGMQPIRQRHAVTIYRLMPDVTSDD